MARVHVQCSAARLKSWLIGTSRNPNKSLPSPLHFRKTLLISRLVSGRALLDKSSTCSKKASVRHRDTHAFSNSAKSSKAASHHSAFSGVLVGFVVDCVGATTRLGAETNLGFHRRHPEMERFRDV